MLVFFFFFGLRTTVRNVINRNTPEHIFFSIIAFQKRGQATTEVGKQSIATQLCSKILCYTQVAGNFLPLKNGVRLTQQWREREKRDAWKVSG